MKRITALFLALLLAVGVFSACGQKNKPQGEYSIVVTVYPAYDWLMQVLGDEASRFDVRLLQDNGVDLHSYQPSTGDIIAISSCDLFIYVGGASDGWVKDALEQATNPSMQVICLLDVLGAKALEEELAEGMQAEEEEDEAEKDEHVWLSLRNAAYFTQQICDCLCSLDKEHAASYRENCGAYLTALQSLDDQYTQTIRSCPLRTLLFADRFPFLYLVKDYGLQYYAAFSGCSAEINASDDTVISLANRLKELGLPAVLILDHGNVSLAETVLEDAGLSLPILELNSIQSVTSENAEGGYLAIMEQNLNTLRTALGG